MTSRHSGLDPRAILEAIGGPEDAVCSPVSGGWDTVIWRVESDNAVYALRLFREDQVSTCRREVAGMRAAEAAGIPVPSIIREGVWHDRSALLLSWCDGQPLGDLLESDLAAVEQLGRSFGEMQARIHRVPAPPELAASAGRWIDLAGAEEITLRAHLAGMELRRDVLLHFDYHPMNVLATGDTVTAVLDWANARAGDPRADFARTAAIVRFAPTPEDMSQARWRIMLRTFEAAWRQGYEAIAGPAGDLAIFYAWAGAMMVRDLEPKLTMPDIWFDRAYLDSIARWAAVWKLRAGVTDESDQATADASTVS